MTKSEILKELQQWEASQKSLETQLERLYDLTFAQPDSDLCTAIYAVAEAHTDAVARLVGDDNGLLNWWVFENDFGKREMSAGKGNKMRPIKALKQLASLIAE